jgi:hypothetical protein
MSSLVHAKCVSSAMPESPRASRRRRTKYSTAFTSCRVVASSAASSSISAWPKSETTARRAAAWSADSGVDPNIEWSVR